VEEALAPDPENERPRAMTSRNVPIRHEDTDLLVADKPAGLLSVPTPGAVGRTLASVLAAEGHPGLLPVHRLDRDVSGLVVLAKHEPARAALESLFRGRAVAKTYWALVRGRLRPERGQFDDPILDEGARARVSPRGKPALTRWHVLAQHRATSAVEIELVTGRYNQIRLHFAHHDQALVGERKYARGKDDVLRAKRVALHAWKLAFTHPLRGERMAVEAPLPEDLRDMLTAAEAYAPSARRERS
jgi:RluA family pseudouridine synthase